MSEVFSGKSAIVPSFLETVPLFLETVPPLQETLCPCFLGGLMR